MKQGQLSMMDTATMLQRNAIGRIGCCDAGRVYVVPVNYVFLGNSLLCRSRKGLKTDIMRRNPNICFEIDEITDSMNWQTLIIEGRFEEITDPAEINDLAGHFTEHMLLSALGEDEVSGSSEPGRWLDDPLAGEDLVIYRILIGKTSGRFQRS